MMKKILPQANSLDTIIKVFMFAGIKENFTKEDIARFCDFDVRQADYYLGACIYLGLFDENLNLTSLGSDIINNDRSHCKERVYEQILSDELAGRFFARLALSSSDDIDEVKRYAKKLTSTLYDYSDAVIKRRSEAMVGWCEEILMYIKNKK